MSSMRRPEYDDLIAVLARNWWAIAIRGVLGISFGSHERRSGSRRK
jgi:hypothetical protein